MFRSILSLLMVLSSGYAMAELQSKEVEYEDDGVVLHGYLAWDDAVSGPRPGVLVVHEWWGNNDYTRMRANMLAELGYTALAIDMYGEGKTADHPQDAQKFMSESIANLPAARSRFNAALNLLNSQSTVDPERTAAIGYCFGGGVVLHMARYGADLDAVASFHGSLGLANAPEGEGEPITARVVAYNGEADTFVSADAIAAFKAEMTAAGADYQFINFPGAVHGFTNPAATANGEKFGLPLKYSPLADQSSWDHMRLLLEAAFEQ